MNRLIAQSSKEKRWADIEPTSSQLDLRNKDSTKGLFVNVALNSIFHPWGNLPSLVSGYTVLFQRDLNVWFCVTAWMTDYQNVRPWELNSIDGGILRCHLWAQFFWPGISLAAWLRSERTQTSSYWNVSCRDRISLCNIYIVFEVFFFLCSSWCRVCCIFNKYKHLSSTLTCNFVIINFCDVFVLNQRNIFKSLRKSWSIKGQWIRTIRINQQVAHKRVCQNRILVRRGLKRTRKIIKSQLVFLQFYSLRNVTYCIKASVDTTSSPSCYQLKKIFLDHKDNISKKLNEWYRQKAVIFFFKEKSVMNVSILPTFFYFFFSKGCVLELPQCVGCGPG